MHISDEESLRYALTALKTAITRQQPDVAISLGDVFNQQSLLETYGAEFCRALLAMHRQWVFVYGNHDGSSTSKGHGDLGWDAFQKVFGPAQTVYQFGAQKIVTLGDQQPDSGWLEYGLSKTEPGTILLSHGPLPQAALDALESKGARFIFSGNDHRFIRKRGVQGRCEQRIQAPFLFAGRTGDVAGYAVVDLSADRLDYRWEMQPLPLMPGNHRVVPGPKWQMPFSKDDTHPDAWFEGAPCRVGPHEWVGGPARLLYRRDGRLQWEKSYGRSSMSTCAPSFARHNGVDYLIIAGTWVSQPPSREFASLMVVDPYTGSEHYRVKVIGVSNPPTIVDGIMYIAGQWREIIAVDLASGRELWRRRSQVETPATAGLSWYDGHTGGGWTTCQPAVGQHVWTVNARGDLFGYDPVDGRECFVHPAAVPLNETPCCPYANRQACVPEGFKRHAGKDGQIIFEVNGQRVNDTTGQLL